MNIDFFNAKNSTLTCQFNKIPLHSSYNPENESKRFVELNQCNFNPKFILITEPCISYISEFLKEKYPQAKLFCIRFSHDFDKFNDSFEKVFYWNNNSDSFEWEIFNFLGELGICQTFFMQWDNASKAFPEINLNVWKSLKKLILKAATIINTCNFFSKTWFLNSVKILTNQKISAKLNKITTDIALIASGPSLTPCINYIKENQDHFFIMAVSSALSVLLNNQIIPDIVISTDGGYWAKKHIEKLSECKNIPLALGPEGACPISILMQNPIVHLTYEDGFESELFKRCKVDSLTAKRNGTVSGTSAELALSITTGNVYAFGLDLFPGTGYQHSQPNMLEPYNESFDCKIKSKETRLSRSRYNSDSLKIYEDWFKNQTESKWSKFFRVYKEEKYSNTLGKVKDIKLSEININKSEKNINCFFDFSENNSSENIRNNIFNFIQEESKSDQWKENFFPLDYLNFQKEKDPEKRSKLLDKINSENCDFILKIKKGLQNNDL